MGLRRIRVEVSDTTYDALRYFGLLRGVPVGWVMRQALENHSVAVQKEFPSVRAHVLAVMAAREAKDAAEVDTARDNTIGGRHEQHTS